MGTPDMQEALKRACDHVGTATELAAKLSERLGRTVHKSSISQWKTANRVPAEICPDIEAITGVRCEDLRPDVNWSVLRKATPEAHA